MIGGTACDVTSASATEIQCDIGQGPAGAHQVMLTVGDKGLARHEGGPFEFTYGFSIVSFEPASGAVGGKGNVHKSYRNLLILL